MTKTTPDELTSLCFCGGTGEHTGENPPYCFSLRDGNPVCADCGGSGDIQSPWTVASTEPQIKVWGYSVDGKTLWFSSISERDESLAIDIEAALDCGDEIAFEKVEREMPWTEFNTLSEFEGW